MIIQNQSVKLLIIIARLGTELVTAFMEYNSYIHIEVQK